MTCQFDLAHYRELLEAAKTGGYQFAGFDQPPENGDLLLRQFEREHRAGLEPRVPARTPRGRERVR